MKANHQTQREEYVYLGKSKIFSRLIIVLMPDEIYEKRIRERTKQIKYQPKAKSRSKDPAKRAQWNATEKGKKAYHISDEFKFRAHFNLFITNIEQKDLEADKVIKFYRVRWQIELTFKVWKSLMHIHHIRKVKYERFVTFIYMSLLWIVVHWKIIFPYRQFLYWQQNRLISIFKSMDTLRNLSLQIRKILQSTKKIAGKQLRQIYFLLSSHHWLEKKKNKESYHECELYCMRIDC